jgi:hydroxyacylglutathione hydrolase
MRRIINSSGDNQIGENPLYRMSKARYTFVGLLIYITQPSHRSINGAFALSQFFEDLSMNQWMRFALLSGAMILSASCSLAQLPEPDGGSIQRGTLPERWATGGPRCMEMPEWQVHEYNADLYILRQSGCTDFEKPFVYLFFGKDKALLLDTGSRNGNLAPTIQRTIHRWLERNSRTSIPLVVVHTHEHGDHVAGDPGLQALNDPAIPLTLIPAKVEANQSFYHIAHWPEDVGSVDLGDRIIDAIPIPGHSNASIALYDRKTAILFSGDTLYPGRLYVRNFSDYVASVTRLVKFTDGKPVAQVLGELPISIIRWVRFTSPTNMNCSSRAVPCLSCRMHWLLCMAARRVLPCGISPSGHRQPMLQNARPKTRFLTIRRRGS